MTGAALVRCLGVGRTYGSGHAAVTAVRAATCSVEPGDTVAIVGPSGSGKSTLLHLMAGLDRPTTGRVEWPAFAELSSLRPWPVSVVFQGPTLLPPLDVFENVALPVLLVGADPETARHAAGAALRELGLEDLGAKLPEELSGGQAQRVGVARALVTTPRLLLADEPTGQLDHTTGAQVMDALLAAAHAADAALVVTTHDHELAARLARQWHMDDGRLGTDDPAGALAACGGPCSG